MSTSKVSTDATWDSKLGRFITTTVLKSLTDWPELPGTAINPHKSYEDGTYTITYQDYTDSGGGPAPETSSTYSYEIHVTTSTEPLKSFWKFSNTALGSSFSGTTPLTASDLVAIQKIESGQPGKTGGVLGWTPYLAGGTEYSLASTGMQSYAILMSRGEDSYLMHNAVLGITDEESSLPGLESVGKIATVANAPALPTGANWLLTGFDATALPNGHWKITKHYRASSYGGWQPFIYT